MFSWFRMLFSFMPDLSGLKELGFKVKILNSDLFVEYKVQAFSVQFYQGLEPHHPELGKIIDFTIPDGVVIVRFQDNGAFPELAKANLDFTFKYLEQRQGIWFLFDQKLDFSTPNMETRLRKVIDAAEKGVSLAQLNS